MAQINDALAGALLGAYGSVFPGGSSLELRAGKSVVATITLPEGPWAASAGRGLDLNGGWSGAASGSGLVDNYRLVSPDGAHEDTGTVSDAGGAGDMRMDNPSLRQGQSVFINSFRKEF